MIEPRYSEWQDKGRRIGAEWKLIVPESRLPDYGPREMMPGVLFKVRDGAVYWAVSDER